VIRGTIRRGLHDLRTIVPFALAALGTACASYRPLVPERHRGEAGNAGAELTALSVPGGETGLHVEASLRAQPGALLARASLADAAAAPCSSHDAATIIFVDGQRFDRTPSSAAPGWVTAVADVGGAPPGAPISVGGAHRLGLDFTRRIGALGATDATDPLRGTSTVDVELADASAPAQPPRCLRVALAGAAPDLAWKRTNPASLGIAFRWSARKPTIAGVHESFTLAGRAGVWVHRRVRLGMESGVTLPLCDGTCPPDVGSFVWVPVNAGVDVAAWQGQSHAFAVQVGYDALIAAGSAPAGARFIQGARLALRYESTAARLPGLPSGAEVSALGYELSVATRSFDAAGSPALVIGLGLIFDRGL
jgi:hypothetical protein